MTYIGAEDIGATLQRLHLYLERLSALAVPKRVGKTRLADQMSSTHLCFTPEYALTSQHALTPAALQPFSVTSVSFTSSTFQRQRSDGHVDSGTGPHLPHAADDTAFSIDRCRKLFSSTAFLPFLFLVLSCAQLLPEPPPLPTTL